MSKFKGFMDIYRTNRNTQAKIPLTMDASKIFFQGDNTLVSILLHILNIWYIRKVFHKIYFWQIYS